MIWPFFIVVPAGPPMQPNIDHIDESSVTLSWQKPKDDGGGNISGYIVEKKGAKDDEWEEVTPEITGNNVKVPRLQNGEQCQFRVKAVNQAGSGSPSMPTQMVT